jgi:hypothetical protein
MRRCTPEKNDGIEEISHNTAPDQRENATGPLRTETKSPRGDAQRAVVVDGNRPHNSSIGEKDPTGFDQENGAVGGGEGRIASILNKITWVPRRCRYDPDSPPQFSLAMNMLMGLVSLICSCRFFSAES